MSFYQHQYEIADTNELGFNLRFTVTLGEYAYNEVMGHAMWERTYFAPDGLGNFRVAL